MSKKTTRFEDHANPGHSSKSKKTINNQDQEIEEAVDDLSQIDYGADEDVAGESRKRVQQSSSDLSSSNQSDAYHNRVHWIKVGILSGIWLFYSIAIVTHKEQESHSIITSVDPKEPKVLDIPSSKDVRHLLGIHMRGAFQEGHEPFDKIDDGKMPYLAMYVQLTENDMVTIVSKKFYFLLNGWDNLQYSPLVERSLVFDLDKDISHIEGKKSLALVMSSNIENTFVVKLWLDLSPINKNWAVPLGALVLILLYVLIIWEFVNRTFAAVVASTLAIGILAALNARPSTLKIMSWVDVETLILLFGMMVLVSILSESGIFDYLAVLAYEHSRGNLRLLIYVLCLTTAILSAFLDNVTMMLLVAPVTIRLCEVCNLNPVPVLMSMVIYSNIGAALTPVGDPPNILIMTNRYINSHGVNFGNFCLHMMPPVVIGMISTFIHLYLRYPSIKSFMNKQSVEIEAVKHEIQVWEKSAQAIPAPATMDEEIVQNTLYKKVKALKQKLKELESKGSHMATDFQSTLTYMKKTYSIRNKALLIKSAVAFIFVLLLFFLHAVPNLYHLSLGWSALIGAILLLILADEEDLETVLSRVEWSTLLFFACLFTLMEALTELGLIEVLGNFCIRIISNISPDYRLLIALLLILWVSGIASAFLANTPVTTMMIKIVITLAQNDELNLPLTPLIWALALGACFGGNGSLIGASANVVSSGVAEQHGYRISFLDFLFFGFPIMINTLAVASIYLYVAHCLLEWH